MENRDKMQKYLVAGFSVWQLPFRQQGCMKKV